MRRLKVPGLPRRPRGRRRAQLRFRVLAGVLAVTLAALAAFDFAAVTALRKYLVGQTDLRLGSVLTQYQGPRLAPILRFVHNGRPRRQLVIPGVLGVYYVGFVASGKLTPIYAVNRGLVPAVPAKLGAVASWRQAKTVLAPAGGAQLRVRAVPVPGEAGTLVASTSLGNVNATIGQLELILTAGSLAAALLVAGGVALVMRRGLRPIEVMAAQADRITAGDLTDRVSPHDPASEVGRLGTALNGMLARIESAVREREASQEATRRFFADASHELRNPLASLRANAELYQQGALPRRSQVDEAMRRIALEAQRMSGLVDDMLRLARLDQQPGQRAGRVDLTALACCCAERAGIASPDRNWKTEIAPGLATTGDEELLRRAIDNLLANVRAHTPPGTTAVISGGSRDGGVTIEVSDDGPGVPAGELPRIFDRFYRAPAHGGGPGSGLGLAIVAAVAAAHDGTVSAAPNDPHGLRVTLALPATSA